MKKYTLLAIIMVAAILFLPLISYAKAQTEDSAGARVKQMTKNQGEEQAVQTQNQEETGAGAEEAGLGSQKAKGQDMGEGSSRRSQVANAVQELLKVADRDGGIGEQIRIIAQEQSKKQEQIENSVSKVKGRGRLIKFFFGPNYKDVADAEQKLQELSAQVSSLKELAKEAKASGDAESIKEQAGALEQVRVEYQGEVDSEKKGFSLFGWVKKIFK